MNDILTYKLHDRTPDMMRSGMLKRRKEFQSSAVLSGKSHIFSPSVQPVRIENHAGKQSANTRYSVQSSRPLNSRTPSLSLRPSKHSP